MVLLGKTKPRRSYGADAVHGIERALVRRAIPGISHARLAVPAAARAPPSRARMVPISPAPPTAERSIRIPASCCGVCSD